MSSAGTPQVVAHSSTEVRSSEPSSSSYPSAWARHHSSSWSPASTIALIIPIAKAASVPGSGRRCSSATRAVRLRNGSTTTSRAPFARASSSLRHRCGAVDSGFQPHTIT